MAPPSRLSGLETAGRAGGGCFICGAMTPLAYAALLRITTPSVAYGLVLLLAASSLCYLGVQRAAITHMGKRQLAAQTASLLVPCLVLARLAGGHIAELWAPGAHA